MEEREFKERQNDRGETVKFLDGYSYLGKDYLQEELDVPKTKKVMALFVELEIDSLDILSDILAKPLVILNKLITTDTITKLLPIILDEKKGSVIQPSNIEDFEVGLASSFKPFILKVFWDFFTLNSGLFGDTANFVNAAEGYVAAVKAPDQAKEQPRKSTSLPKAKPKRSRKSRK